MRGQEHPENRFGNHENHENPIRYIIPIYRQRVKKRGVLSRLSAKFSGNNCNSQSAKQCIPDFLIENFNLEFPEVFFGKNSLSWNFWNFCNPPSIPTNALTICCLRNYMVPWCGGRFYTDKESSKGAYVASHHNIATVKSNNFVFIILFKPLYHYC